MTPATVCSQRIAELLTGSTARHRDRGTARRRRVHHRRSRTYRRRKRGDFGQESARSRLLATADRRTQPLHVTPSIGISVYPEDGEDAATLLRNADTAMYHAKERGRNNFQFFTPAMNLVIQERASIENDLHSAIERDEFELLLPTAGQLPQRRGHRHGSIDSLAPPAAWSHSARSLHPDRRGNRSHRQHRSNGC
jgi:hypothetical protein